MATTESAPAATVRPAPVQPPASTWDERLRSGARDRLRTVWASLGAAPARQVPGTTAIVLVVLAIGLIASVISAASGWNLAYSDAQSHLTIARRIIDSRAPGFQQLGTVWLPAPHLVLLPFVQSTWLWHTGLAAGLVGAGCLAASAGALYRICARIGLNRAGRLTALGLFLANPSMLYAYTTALTEPYLITAILLTFAGIARWMTSDRKLSGGELAVFAGAPAGFAVLSRYEGWALSVVGTTLVLFVALRRWRSWRYAIRMAFSFAAIPVLAIVWWVSYNWTVFGSPLEFAVGEYSASAQQAGLLDAGALPTKGNLGLSVYTLAWAIIPAAGAVLIALALAGALVLTYTRGLRDSALLVWSMALTIVFQTVSLYAGQTAIQNDHSFPTGWWNNRFALSMVPVLTVLAGVLVDYVTSRRAVRERPAIKVAGLAALGLAIAAQNLWWSQDLPTRSAVIAEAVVSRTESADSRAAAEFLAAHYDGGSILIDETQTAVLPLIGVPLEQYVFRAAGEDFDKALASPTTYAKWIVVNRAPRPGGGAPYDVVGQTLLEHADRFSSYQTVYENGRYAVMERFTS